MQQASMIVLNNKQCREYCKKHFPIDAQDLFNQTWLDLREVEILKPEWRPNNAVTYFLSMVKNKAMKLKRDHARREPFNDNIDIEKEEVDERIEIEVQLLNWVDSPSINDEVLFYKSLVRILLYSNSINDACRIADINRVTYWRYRKKIVKQFYEDTNFNANIDIFFGDPLV